MLPCSDAMEACRYGQRPRGWSGNRGPWSENEGGDWEGLTTSQGFRLDLWGTECQDDESRESHEWRHGTGGPSSLGWQLGASNKCCLRYHRGDVIRASRRRAQGEELQEEGDAYRGPIQKEVQTLSATSKDGLPLQVRLPFHTWEGWAQQPWSWVEGRPRPFQAAWHCEVEAWSLLMAPLYEFCQPLVCSGISRPV